VARDAEARRRLSETGYVTFVIWECETRDAARLRKRISQIRGRIANLGA